MTNSTDSIYATAEEQAAVMRQATPNEAWLNTQLDRIDPHRHEMGSAGDTPALVKLVFELRDQLKDMEDYKDNAYLERNQVVAAIARCFPSGVGRTAIEGWSDDWQGCVYIDLPTGQVSWHFHASQMHLLAGLPEYRGEWDGHTTAVKYKRLAGLKGAHNMSTHEMYKLLADSTGAFPMDRCPVCASHAELWQYSTAPDAPTNKTVMCSNGEKFGPQEGLSNEGCLLFMPPDEFYKATIREAVKYWNEYAKALTAQQRKRRWEIAQVLRGAKP